jgi:hypothetical protein
MNLWVEWEIPESAEADIGQTERRMIEHDVAAALGAIAAIADSQRPEGGPFPSNQ